MTSFGVLGPLTVSHDGQAITLGGAKQRVILAMLLLNPGRTVSVDRLIDGIWADAAPPGVTNTLQAHVSHLRRALAVGDTSITTRAPGYLITVSSAQLDLLRFDELTRVAQERIAEGQHAAGAELLRSALDLWRGPALEDLGPGPFSDSARTYLEERRFGIINDRLELELQLGRDQVVIETCEMVLGSSPLRESLWEKLIVALYRSGRQSDALAKFRLCRAVLMDELGVEPMPRLRLLEQQILNQDPRLAAVRATSDGLVVPVEVDRATTSTTGAATVQRLDRLDADLLLDDGTAVRLTEVTVLGRHPSCDIVVDDLSVSRRHAEIRIANGRHVLFDLSSSNGTWVAGEPVLQHLLRDGDAFEIGDQTLRYRTRESVRG
jgi:DNA-binding SARP family transcriptional activator